MSTGSKNGKHCTNSINIYSVIIIILITTNLQSFADIPEKKEGYVIVIDPGHGGRDPGAVGSFSYEKNITLAIALRTGEYLEKNLPNVKVVYTRKTDVFVELYIRSDIANKNNADLFISIHANANKVHNAYGTETYVMGTSQNEANLEVAMKENQVILLENDYSTRYEGFDPKSPESYIMFTLMQNTFLKQSTDLASMIQKQYKNQIGRFDRGVQQAGFQVLYKTTMPSVLTETGFISNLNEEKYITSKQGQDNIAASIYRACKEYFGEIDKKSITSTVKTEPVVQAKDTIKATSENRNSIIYMVQIATSGKKIEIKPSNFKNIKEIVELYSGNRFRYATGRFNDYDQAVSYRKKIENIYPDAFVIAVKDNKILPLQEALEKK
jgi:N-acetylmuramoyl-L-alanine amidase